MDANWVWNSPLAECLVRPASCVSDCFSFHTERILIRNSFCSNDVDINKFYCIYIIPDKFFRRLSYLVSALFLSITRCTRIYQMAVGWTKRQRCCTNNKVQTIHCTYRRTKVQNMLCQSSTWNELNSLWCSGLQKRPRLLSSTASQGKLFHNYLTTR